MSRITSIAINSLIGYRTFRYGKHLDLIITDQHSYRSPDPFSDDSLDKLGDWAAYDGWFPEDLQQVLDGGPRLQWRQSARRTRVRGGAHPEPAEGRAAADHPRRRAEGVVQGSAEARRPRRGRSGAIRKGRSTSASTRRTSPLACSPSRGRRASPMPARTIMAAPGWSAARSTTLSATRRSPALRSSRATATASGRDMRRPNFRPESSSQ